MKHFSTEADARIVIDDWLKLAGWDPTDKSMILTEVPVGLLQGATEGKGFTGASITTDRDEIPTGRADYVLLSQNGRPLAVVEAKRSAIQP